MCQRACRTCSTLPLAFPKFGMLRRVLVRGPLLLLPCCPVTGLSDATAVRAYFNPSPLHRYIGEDADDALVRMLVQDGFRGVVESCATDAKRTVAPGSDVEGTVVSAAHSLPQETREEVLPSTTVAPPCCSSGPLPKENQGSITDSRQFNQPYEVYATIRRKVPPEASKPNHLGLSQLPSIDIEWMCLRCQTYNDAHSTRCFQCTAEASLSYQSALDPVRHVPLLPRSWVCRECAATNTAALQTGRVPSIHEKGGEAGGTAARKKFLCTNCSHPFDGVCDWYCAECHHLNSRASTQCATCFVERPISWLCQHCNFPENSIFSTRCHSCGWTREHKISNSTVLCRHCSSRNDVRWELCTTCMAPLNAMLCGRSMPDSAAEPKDTSVVPRSEQNLHHIPPVMPTAPPLDEAVTVATPSAVLHSPTALGEKSTPEPDQHVKLTSAIVRAGKLQRLGKTIGGGWWCPTCNVPQRRNANFCDICLYSRDELTRYRKSSMYKDAATEPPTPNTAVEISVELGDWQCPYCRKFVKVKQMECCGHRREVPQGYWLCDHCASTNRAERGVCLGCGQKPSPVTPWTCTQCTFRNSAQSTSCLHCTMPHPLVWRCETCQTYTSTADEACTKCGANKPSPGVAVDCPVCAAPNAAVRASCYRCHARLQDGGWQCTACNRQNAASSGARCSHCQTPRSFDMREEVWICEVCTSAVSSGGAIPIRHRCPLCKCKRASRCPHFPARWQCRCGLCNRARVKECRECGTQRCLVGLQTAVECPHCLKTTILDSREVCEHCSQSLSTIIDTLGDSIVMSYPAGHRTHLEGLGSS